MVFLYPHRNFALLRQQFEGVAKDSQYLYNGQYKIVNNHSLLTIGPHVFPHRSILSLIILYTFIKDLEERISYSHVKF